MELYMLKSPKSGFYFDAIFMTIPLFGVVVVKIKLIINLFGKYT